MFVEKVWVEVSLGLERVVLERAYVGYVGDLGVEPRARARHRAGIRI